MWFEYLSISSIFVFGAGGGDIGLELVVYRSMVNCKFTGVEVLGCFFFRFWYCISLGENFVVTNYGNYL